MLLIKNTASKLLSFSFLSTLVSLSFLSPTAHAIPINVNVELALVIDVSGSVDQDEYLLQRNGYVNAFKSSAVQNAITSMESEGGVAVAVWFFDDTATQKIDWVQLTSQASINDFAAELFNISDDTYGGTNIAAGMTEAITSIESNNYFGARKIIDVSGDGKQNRNLNGNPGTCTNNNYDSEVCKDVVKTARDLASLNLITVNGLAIEDTFPSLDDYFISNVMTDDGFVLDATFLSFENAIQKKLLREITNEVPAPATILLMVVGILGITLSKKFRFNS